MIWITNLMFGIEVHELTDGFAETIKIAIGLMITWDVMTDHFPPQALR